LPIYQNIAPLHVAMAEAPGMHDTQAVGDLIGYRGHPGPVPQAACAGAGQSGEIGAVGDTHGDQGALMKAAPAPAETGADHVRYRQSPATEQVQVAPFPLHSWGADPVVQMAAAVTVPFDEEG